MKIKFYFKYCLFLWVSFKNCQIFLLHSVFLYLFCTLSYLLSCSLFTFFYYCYTCVLNNYFSSFYILEVKHDTKETFSSTIKRYSNRLGALQKVLDSLPKHSCVEDLQKQLKDLEKKFTSTKLGIGGGTFEWVDSILVKVITCLQFI